MYAYTHDPQTGGLLLNDSTPLFSKEPRPVYYRELDILGLDNYWNYEKQDELPYMWAEANYYWYCGQAVFKTKGGSLYAKPGLEFLLDAAGAKTLPEGSTLRPVNIAAMVKKNRELLQVVEQVTVKRIFEVYKNYRKKLDVFHVAFSGGKDSIVLLNLVKKALPKSGFVVVFGDTGMEFPDTYDVIDKTEEQCRSEEIAFYRATSHFKPEESWRLFGPPSRVLRWCCSVHKSVPQTLNLREVLGKNNYVGMDFVGVRAYESAARAGYDYENYGKKQKGQYSHNSILEWSSAEVWMYIYAHDLAINETYKKGNSRAGCLFCPMGSGKSDSFRNLSYPNEIKKYTDIIRESIDDKNIESYITNGGWESRSSGRDIKKSTLCYSEKIIDDTLQISVINPKTDWREWIKTLSEIPFRYKVSGNNDGYTIAFPISANSKPATKLFKQVFLKSAYCVGCRACEANCRKGCLSFSGTLRIEDCTHCGQCHMMPYGCYVADCLKKPLEGKPVKSINTFDDHAPLKDWVSDFFKKPKEFLFRNGLGPNQQTKFKRFLSDSALIRKNDITDFCALIIKIGWESEPAWGLILVQLAYKNPQIRWYIDNLAVGNSYSRKSVEDMLVALAISHKDAKSIAKAFARLCKLPLGTKLNFGAVAERGGGAGRDACPQKIHAYRQSGCPLCAVQVCGSVQRILPVYVNTAT
jgi:phosphoadenosine phosphosulfate reductase